MGLRGLMLRGAGSTQGSVREITLENEDKKKPRGALLIHCGLDGERLDNTRESENGDTDCGDGEHVIKQLVNHVVEHD